MAINMTLKGVPDSMGILISFLVLTMLNLVMAGLLLKHVDERFERPMPSAVLH